MSAKVFNASLALPRDGNPRSTVDAFQGGETREQALLLFERCNEHQRAVITLYRARWQVTPPWFNRRVAEALAFALAAKRQPPTGGYGVPQAPCQDGSKPYCKRDHDYSRTVKWERLAREQGRKAA